MEEKLKKLPKNSKIFYLDNNTVFENNILEYLEDINDLDGNIICYNNTIVRDRLEEKKFKNTKIEKKRVIVI